MRMNLLYLSVGIVFFYLSLSVSYECTEVSQRVPMGGASYKSTLAMSFYIKICPVATLVKYYMKFLT